MKIFGRTAVQIVFLAAVLGAASRAVAQPSGLRAGDPGQVVDLPGGRGLGELLSFDVAFAPRLLAMKPEEGQEVTDFPTSPGVRRRVYLVRHEIYAQGARIFRVDGRFYTEIPRSRLAFFWGSDLEGAGNRMFVSLDPDTGSFTGLVHGPEGMHEIARDPSDRRGRHLLAEPQARQGATWTCGQEDSVETAVSWAPPEAERRPAVSIHPNVLTSLHSAVVAIDTDNEYLAYWGNNTTNVTNYIAQLLASINVMYERDLNLRLLQGTTFLRVSTTPDPYVQSSGSGANTAELNEFTNYWNANYPEASYPRSVATMLSGKQSLNNSASGIAWLASSVCGSSMDYSFCQVFKINYLVGDTLVVGHEIGHNLGSPHTHCYADPKPDTCYAQESGTNCFSGTPSCPGSLMINGYNATGTIMSYCHLSPCSSSSTLAFHPLTISRYVGTTLDAGASSGCLAVVGGGTPPPPPVSAATRFNPITPCRVLDTRNAVGPLGGPSMGAGGSRSFVATGVVCNVPAGTVAISANVTVVNPAATGDFLVYPNGIASPPIASSLSFRSGRTRANNAIVYLASDGSFLVKNNAAGSFDLVLDVNGYFK